MQRKASEQCVKLQQRVIRGVQIEIRRAKRDLEWELRVGARRLQNLQNQESRYIAKLEGAYRDVADLIAQGKRLTRKQLDQLRMALARHDRHKRSDLYDLVVQLKNGDEGSNHQHGLSQRHDTSSNDPVAEAIKIARAASVGGIDWTREPTNERERLVRDKVLFRRYSGMLGSFILSVDMGKLGVNYPDKYPSDVRKFYEEQSQWEDTERQKEFSAEMQHEVDRASREVDGLTVEDDDDDEELNA